MNRMQRALDSMLSNEALTGDLNDREAQALLQWGKHQLERLDAQAAPEPQFDEQVQTLARVMQYVNSFVGYRQVATADEQHSDLQKLTEFAARMGVSVPSDQVEHFLQEHGTLDNVAAIQRLLALLSGSQPESSIVQQPAGTIKAEEAPTAPLSGDLLAKLKGLVQPTTGKNDASESGN